MCLAGAWCSVDLCSLFTRSHILLGFSTQLRVLKNGSLGVVRLLTWRLWGVALGTGILGLATGTTSLLPCSIGQAIIKPTRLHQEGTGSGPCLNGSSGKESVVLFSTPTEKE